MHLFYISAQVYRHASSTTGVDAWMRKCINVKKMINYVLFTHIVYTYVFMHNIHICSIFDFFKQFFIILPLAVMVGLND